eukprot:scpid71635/ scgid31319/ 
MVGVHADGQAARHGTGRHGNILTCAAFTLSTSLKRGEWCFQILDGFRSHEFDGVMQKSTLRHSLTTVFNRSCKTCQNLHRDGRRRSLFGKFVRSHFAAARPLVLAMA